MLSVLFLFSHHKIIVLFVTFTRWPSQCMFTYLQVCAVHMGSDIITISLPFQWQILFVDIRPHSARHHLQLSYLMRSLEKSHLHLCAVCERSVQKDTQTHQGKAMWTHRPAPHTERGGRLKAAGARCTILDANLTCSLGEHGLFLLVE